MKSFFHSAAAAANLRINKISNIASETTQLIGQRGAAEVLSTYIKSHEQLSKDQQLASFMNFYCEHWSLSSSQWSQDIFVMYASKMKRNGLFLEIGGADGFTHSNTYSLEKSLNWRGTLVEPDSAQFRQLKYTRPSNNLLNLAISPDGGNEEVKIRKAGQLSAIIGQEGNDTHLKKRMLSKSFAQIKSIPITSLLAEKEYDYFSLDVEGAELSILQSIKWDCVNKPQAITVEHNNREDDRKQLLELLVFHGYRPQFQEYPWLTRGDIWACLDDKSEEA
jgi:FkbM family methyltransferase